MQLDQEELLRLVMDAVPQAVVVTDEAGEVLFANAPARQLLPVVGSLPEALSPEQTAGMVDWPALSAALDAAPDGVTMSDVPLDLGRRKLLLDMFFRRLGGGDEPHVLAVLWDVSQRVVAERRRVAGERMAATEKLASQVAHELNNPLDGVLRYINLARRTAADPIASYLDKAQSGLLRMAEIIREMLGQSRRASGPVEATHVEKLLDEAITVMQPAANALGVSVVCEVEEAAMARGPSSLFQVFCNIVKNALDAMPSGGLLNIRMRRRADRCVVEFADTGCGMTADEATRIFEPFYTTKPPGEGTGLGLTICRDIVTRLGGTIDAAPRPTGGAVLTVQLPLSAHGRGAGAP